MSTPGRLVLIDTMIIFEAYRTGCWKALFAKVTNRILAAAFTASPRIANLDDGEQHLLAYMNSLDHNEIPLLLTTADRAALYAACELGFQDQLTSLEELLRTFRVQRPLKKLYLKSFLTLVKTQFLLGG